MESLPQQVHNGHSREGRARSDAVRRRSTACLALRTNRLANSSVTPGGLPSARMRSGSWRAFAGWPNVLPIGGGITAAHASAQVRTVRSDWTALS
jgi:hypothetical protein